MTADRKREIANNIFAYFPSGMRSLLGGLTDRTMSELTEIRLRAGRPLSLTVGGENVFVSVTGQICHLNQQGLYTVSYEEITNIFRSMCDCSLYAYSEQIKSGYIVLKNGCRAGLAATAVYENGRVTGLKSVSSINIRIAAEYIDSARELVRYCRNGTLIAGPPASGKTTLLRDLVRLVSNGTVSDRKRVALIDVRGEIASVHNGVPQNDVGQLTDVINSCDKVQGIEIALRTLNPQVIAFDEICSEKEANAVIGGFFTGVDIITTAHLGCVEEAHSRAAVRSLLVSGAVKTLVFTNKPGETPQIYNVMLQNDSFILNEAKEGVVSA